jgi:Sigma-70 region 2
MGSLTDAEDVLQEALLAAWRGLDGFEGRASLRSWLYRIATNRCLNVLRDRGRRIPPEPLPPFHADGHHPIDRGSAVTDPDIGSWFITFPLRTSWTSSLRPRPMPLSRRTDPRDAVSRRSRERSGGRGTQRPPPSRCGLRPAAAR